MERNRDSRRATVSAANCLPRRRQSITTLRDSIDEDRQMELQETVRLGDREQVSKKNREREFPKRRRIDRSAAQQRSDGGESYRENESTDSSDEEYFEEEEEMRIHQQDRVNQISPASSSLSNNRRGLRTLRSSPVLKSAADEMLGVPVPRRARSSSAKRLQEYCNSASGGFGEDLSLRRISPLRAAVSLIGSGDSMKKKKFSERRMPISNPKQSAIEDDIEIEVAEALFDLMKQSQSQSQSQSQLQSSQIQNVDRDRLIPASDELKMSKADCGQDENNAFSVQNEPSKKVNAGRDMGDSMKELKKDGRIEKERFPDDTAVSVNGFVNKVKVGSPKESESPSCVKVNACDIQDPTVTKAHDAIIVEDKKETKLEIDLMSSPLLSSPEREGLVDMGTNPSVMAQAVQKKSEVAAKDQQLNLDVEKHCNQQQGRKENKNQSPTSLLHFPIGMSSWPGVLPHPGFMPPLQAMPGNGIAKSSMIMQPPQFKFSQPRPKRCAAHQFLAQSIHCHQQLIKESLSTGPAVLCRSKSPTLKSTAPAQNFFPGNPFLREFQGGQNLAIDSVGSGKDKSSDTAVALNATSTKSLLQQASHPASASSFLHGHGFWLPFGHHQATMMAPVNSSGSPQSATSAANATLQSTSAGRLPNIPLSNASTALSLIHPMLPSNESSPYMAILQNNGSIPISTNISIPPFNGGSHSMPFFNSSLYPSLTFNQQQFTTSHASAQSASPNTNLSSHRQPQSSAKTSENKFLTSISANLQSGKVVQPSYSSSKSNAEVNWKNGVSLAPGFISHSAKPSNSPQQMNHAMYSPTSVGSGAAGNKQIDPPQQGSKGRVELIPQAYALSFGSNSSATPVLNFSSMAQSSGMFHMLRDTSLNGNQMHQKNFQNSEGKSLGSGGQSFSSEISALSAMGPPKFDTRTVNFLPSSFNGSQPFQTSSGVSVPNFQQHQLIQLQDHQMHQIKSSTPHNIHGSFLTGILPSSSSSSNPMFDPPSFHPKWENFPRSAAPESTTSNVPQLKSSQGQTHSINFGNAPVQGHQFVMKSESRNAATSIASTTPPLPSQEVDGQKSSSPACRRNVPSILSACPSQLPELKY
ncbi:protein TIME FOR COFFEE-like isoform X2 [Salvia splendens]|uniref:protein TIME FOR COFFEE-like isoform X2 n=1 Tax=Salvia splendens TaxID=180675 RepID=UPI001C27DAE7|nr:protein TIME FOR COFFEE-like isoform X2 [Salvia splendens]